MSGQPEAEVSTEPKIVKGGQDQEDDTNMPHKEPGAQEEEQPAK